MTEAKETGIAWKLCDSLSRCARHYIAAESDPLDRFSFAQRAFDDVDVPRDESAFEFWGEAENSISSAEHEAITRIAQSIARALRSGRPVMVSDLTEITSTGDLFDVRRDRSDARLDAPGLPVVGTGEDEPLRRRLCEIRAEVRAQRDEIADRVAKAGEYVPDLCAPEKGGPPVGFRTHLEATDARIQWIDQALALVDLLADKGKG